MNKKRGLWLCSLIGVMLLLLLGSALAGCAPAEKPTEDAAAPEAQEPAAPERPEEQAEAPEEVDDYAGDEEVEGRRYVIRDGRLSLLVKDLDEAISEVQQRVTDLGGHVSSMNLHGLERERRAGQIVVRVPEDRFDQAMAEFEELGDSKDKNISTDDVTREYIDMEARIENLKSQEERFRELLQEAQDIEEILEVENELGRIRSDLESMQAQFKNLREQVNYSTITINFEERDPRQESVVSETEGMGERIASLFSVNMNRLISAFSGTLVFLLGTLPITIPLVVVIIAGWKIGTTLKKRKSERS